MNKSGSKLNYLVDLENNKKNFKDEFIAVFSKKNLVIIIKGLIYMILMHILNIIVFYKIIFSDFLILNLGYKKIDVVSTFDSYWTGYIKIYYIVYTIFLIIIYVKYITKSKNKIRSKNKKEDLIINDISKIYLGSTIQKSKVYIDKEELYKNVLITGSIGTGKTSGAINTFCKYMVQNNIPGIVIDIKGNYVSKVKSFLNNNNVEIVVVGDESTCGYNPIRRDINSMEMANRLRKVIELISISNTSDSYWLDKVENVLFNVLLLIKHCHLNIDLQEIHRCITDDEYLNRNLDKLKDIVVDNINNDKTVHEINNLLLFFRNEYFKLDIRTTSIIKSEITRLTIPFVTEYDVCKKYGTESKDNTNLTFSNITPKIVIFSMNMSKNFLLTKILATFIKLDFQSEVLQKISNPIETFCICDEYQEFANKQDAHFLSLSREAKCMNIFSMQSYSSLNNTLKNEYASNVIIQNLVNKIWFRNDDNYTSQEIVKQIGQEKKQFKTSSISEGAEESKKSILSGFKNKKSNISKTISYAENNDNIVSSKVITQELEVLEALVLFGSNGKMNEIQRIKFEREEDNE